MSRKDLIVLVADKDMEHTLTGLLNRPQALNIRAIETDIRVHPQHDPACARHGVSFLSNFTNQYRHALLLFDHEGSGRENLTPIVLESSLNEEFSNSRWGERARTIVLSPELETWVWSGSTHVSDVAGWGSRPQSLRNWLVE